MNKIVQRWQLLALSLLVIFGMMFTLLPSPIPFGGAGVAGATTYTEVVFLSDTTWTVPSGVSMVQVLVVGGGGGGGYEFAGGGGGGAANYDAAFSVTPGASVTVTIGVGGAAAPNISSKGVNGGQSAFGAKTAIGGGGGGSNGNKNGADGGSGGGAAYKTSSGTGGVGNPGKDGGTAGSNGGGGGGGMGVAGSNGATNVGGNGGNGVDYSAIFASTFGDPSYRGWVSGGGGGCGWSSTGTSGKGGAYWPVQNNTGGGGVGGWTSSYQGTPGSSGVVVVQYTPALVATSLAATLVKVTSATLGGNITEINTGGNVTQYGFVWSLSSHANPGSASPSTQTSYAGNWTSGTVDYGVGQTFTRDITGLTGGFYYYFRAAIYNASGGWVYGNELFFVTSVSMPIITTSDASEISTTGAMLNGIVTDLGETIHQGISVLRARYIAARYHGTHDRTYFTWGDKTLGNGTVCINYYDHDTSVLGVPVYMGWGIGTDAHNSPALHIIPSGTYAGYILVVWKDTSGNMLLRRSSNPEDLDNWDSPQTITGSGLYRQLVHIGDGKDALFDVEGNIVPDNYYNFGYRTTSDGGQTWSSRTVIVQDGTGGWDYGVVVTNGNATHIAWQWTSHDVHYVYSPDNLATWRTQGNSTPLSLPVTRTTGEEVLSYYQCWTEDIQVDGSGSPVISFIKMADGSTVGNAMWAHYSSGWSVHDTGLDAGHYGHSPGSPGTDALPYQTGIFIDFYDTTHVYVGVETSSTTSEIQEWYLSNHGANTWTKVADITTNSPGWYDEPRPVVNYGSDLKLIYNLITSWTTPLAYDSTIRSYPYAIGIPKANFTDVGFVWDSAIHESPGDIAPDVQTLYPGNYTSGVVSYGAGTAFDHEITEQSNYTIYFRAAGYDATGTWNYGNEETFNLLIDISNTPATKDFGTVQPSTYYWGKSGTQTGPGSWPLQESDCVEAVTYIYSTDPSATFTINILFSMSAMTGGITWNPGTTPGANVFVMKAGIAGVANESAMTKLSAAYQELITNLSVGDHIHWEFVFYTPTNLLTNNDTAVHTGYITLGLEVND